MLIMLKQSPSRNQRSKGFKLKHAIQLIVVFALCIWMLYQAKQSCCKKKNVALKNSTQVLPKGLDREHVSRLGRKGLNPRSDEVLELEDEEKKLRNDNGDDGGGEDEEIDANDQEKANEEEHEQFEDLIDEDDKEEQLSVQ